MKQFIAYYRVSTDKQGRSGLGLEAQTETVSRYIENRGELLSEFTEIESGKKTDRPALSTALELCRRKKATLLIAKLDRLARNVHFISGLMESGVDFVAVDMPEANRLTLHIMAAFAEHEREQISQRTKAALAAAKRRGVKLGNPQPENSLRRGRITHQRQAQERRSKAYPLIQHFHEAGLSNRGIARALNERGERTPRGSLWSDKQVARILKSCNASPIDTASTIQS